MTKSDRFTEIHRKMNVLRDQAIQRAADLKIEVICAINALKKIDILPKEIRELVVRFSDVEILPGIPREIISDLIDGFQCFAEKYRLKYAFVANGKMNSTTHAIENLTRIIESKDTEIREFEQQGKPRRKVSWVTAIIRKLFKISHN